MLRRRLRAALVPTRELDGATAEQQAERGRCDESEEDGLAAEGSDDADDEADDGGTEGARQHQRGAPRRSHVAGSIAERQADEQSEDGGNDECETHDDVPLFV